MSAHLSLRRGALADEDRVTMRRIATSAARAQRMLDQLTDFTRARAGLGITIERRPCDLVRIVREVVDELVAAQPGATVGVEACDALLVEGDSDRLAQVASNLVGNALQHGAGSDVRVRILVDGDGDAAVIEVNNGGPEIPPERHGTIFDPFRRGLRLKPGANLGLGLYIVREIVRAHGGDVALTSTPIDGTTVRARLPR
jgi:signal transduction histidine kinase